MKHWILLAVIAFVALSMSACGGDRRVYTDDPDPTPSVHRPELRAFHLIDSFGVSTEDEYDPELVIDPYYDDGLFEIFWNVSSAHDYRVEYRVNDTPDISGSQLVYTERCGAGRECDQSGLRLCQYYTDYAMACGMDDEVTYVEHLIYEVPQILYSIVRVCNLSRSYCEYEYHPVWME